MTLIEWKEDFSVGIPDVDFEHQVLIELINKLHENLAADNADYGVPEFLDEIYEHLSEHFTHEEKVMNERKYARFMDHKQDHEKLLGNMRAIMGNYQENAYFNDREFAENVQQWFIEHFKSCDTPLHRFLE